MNAIPLTPSQLDTCHKQLLEEKRDLEHRLIEQDDHGLSLSQRESTQELSMIDNHPADTATDLAERSKDLAINQHEHLHLTQIYEALSRIQAGTYGICMTCHDYIDADRLLALPTTATCRAHMQDHAPLDRRPIEEEVLSPPFGRTSLDEREDEQEFDGEDAWQIVESWGNSDSPAMAEDADVTSYEHLTIESDELDGYVEPIESFIATDLSGQHVQVVRNKAYYDYLRHQEGDPLLEPDSLVRMRDREARERELLAREREHLAREHDTAARESDIVAGERETAACESDIVAGERETAASPAQSKSNHRL